MYLLYQHNKITKKKLQKFNQVIIIMGVHTDNNKLAKITEPKTIHFDLSKNFDNNVKYETDFYHKTQ